MLILIIITIFFSEFSASTQNNFPNDFLGELTNNLIENLRVDPFLIGISRLSELPETAKEFIDKHTEQYSELALTSQQRHYSRSKRNFMDDSENDVQNNIIDVAPYNISLVTPSNDISIFQQNSTMYVVILKNTVPENGSNLIIIMKNQGDALKFVTEMKIQNGLRVAAFSLENSTLIAVAQSNNITKIFELNRHEKLENIETIQRDGCKDVAIWEDNGNVFMSLVGFMGNSQVSSSYFPRVYRWRGRHFDGLQDIRSGTTRISPFMIGDSGFLAVAYNESQDGEKNENVYSEILKYNVNTEKYELFQKILTYACDDIKYFEIDTVGEKGESVEERFLVVTNSYKKDLFGNKRTAPSIFYKFVDNYFYPFQCVASRGVFQWEVVKNQHGDVLLIALTIDGIKSFQYDGWSFIETSVNFQRQSLSVENMSDVKMVHTFVIGNNRLLVLARTNPTENKPSILQINFSKQDKLKELHDQLLTWCQHEVQAMTERDSILREKNGKLELQQESQTQSLNLDSLMSTINSYNSKISTIQNNLENKFKQLNISEKDVNVTLLVLNSTATLESVFSDNINNFNMSELLENKMDINNEIEIVSEVRADFLVMNSTILLNYFNNHSINNFVYKTDTNNLKVMNIKGNVIFNDSVVVTNTLNNISITHDTILLKKGDQNLQNMIISEIHANRLNTGTINGKVVDEVLGRKMEGTPTNISNGSEDPSDDNIRIKKVRRFEKVKVKNLMVGGFINDVDIPTLEIYALRKAGNQTITETYYIDNVETEWVDSPNISGKTIPEDLILINNGNINIPKVVKFDKPITIEKLQVKNLLNTIPVSKSGDLDVLSKHFSNQRITGVKSFDNLNLLDPIGIQEKIKSPYFDSINPRKIISSNLITNDTIIITGNVTIENMLNAMDIIPKESGINYVEPTVLNTNGTNFKPLVKSRVTSDSVSMARVVKRGIRLNDTNISVHLKFMKDLVTKKVHTKLINNLDPFKFVIENSNYPVKIKGIKTFTGNLKILGDINVTQINGMNVTELESNVLKTTTNQILTGDYYMKDVTITRSLKSNLTKLGTHLWKNVVTQNDVQNLKGNWTLTNLKANSTIVKNIRIQGLINGINFTEFIEDAVPTDTQSKVFGTKNCQALNVNHLWINNNFDLDKHIKDVVDGKIVLKKAGKIDSVSAEKVYFRNHCNEIEKSEFENANSSHQNGTFIVNDVNKFDKIIVLGSVFVEDNKLNHLDIDDFEFETVKIDEPTIFENADFGKLLTVTPKITHHGQIENLDFDNVFENGKTETQIFNNRIIFKDDVLVNGTVNISDHFNGKNISDLCGILSTFKKPKKLVIEGSVHFTKGPQIKTFNGLNATMLENQIWFTDDPATLSGNVAFNNNVIFRDICTIKGLLNDVHLDRLSSNYLSKTKDQTIVAHIELLNKTIFKDDVATPMVAVGGLVNDIKLETFLKNILLHRPQLFEEMSYFEEVSVKHLEGSYLVNKLNLDSEVMRYDRLNLITGSKKFENLHIEVLRPKEEGTLTGVAKIQGIDVREWLQNAVLNKGNIKIEGRKIFKDVEVKEETSVIGHFNGIKFNADTIMMRHAQQNITGKKTFMLNTEKEVRFKALKVKGLVNGENLEKLLKNRAYKNDDNTFTSTLHFCNNITAKNVEFKTKFAGVDVPKLLQNITTLGTLNHIKERYKNLNDMASQVESTLKDQAYFLDYYKPVLMTFRVDELFSIRCFGSGEKVMSVTNETGSNILRFLDWNDKHEIFRNISAARNIASYPNYIAKIRMGNIDRVYMEQPMRFDGDSTHTGRFMVCNNNNLEFMPVPFLTKGTHFLTSFEMKSKETWCLLFVDFNFDINILCADENGKFQQNQIIKNESPVMVNIATMNDLPMLITIHGKNDKKTVLWILNNKKFEIFQTFREGEPISVSAVSTENETFLAVAYKHLPNTKDFGRVVIRRIKNLSTSLSIFQTIPISTPTKVELTLLPSNEIALYVITENPSEPLTVYLYKGVQGFVKKVWRPTLSIMKHLTSFSFNNQHFVVLKNNIEVNVLQAVFKGSKF